VYPYDRWTGNVIPQFEVGQVFVPTAISMKDGSTSAPPLLSEDELIAIMDRNGIGTRSAAVLAAKDGRWLIFAPGMVRNRRNHS
jgi:DNA topoisomerase IA